MEPRDRLLRLLYLLKQNNCPRDDSLLSKFLTLLADYCRCHNFNPALASDGIFDMVQWRDAGHITLSFLVQLAGICGSVCDENSGDLVVIERFLMEAIAADSSSSVSCAWLKAWKCIILKHKREPLSDETLSHIATCLLGSRGYFAGEDALLLVECLVENGLFNADLEDHRRAVEFILSSLVLKFKEDPACEAILQKTLILEEKVHLLEESLKGQPEILASWISILSDGMAEALRNSVCKLRTRGAVEVGRALNFLHRVLVRGGSHSSEVSVFFEILKDSIHRDDKVKALQVAAWLVKSSSCQHLRSELEHLCLSPLLQEVGRQDENPPAEWVHFIDSLFNSEILCHVFKIVASHDFEEPDKVVCLCMEFLHQNCLEARMGSRRPVKCIRACLDGLKHVASIDRRCLARDLGPFLVMLLLAVQEDNLALTKAFEILARLTKSRREEDNDLSTRIHGALHSLVQSQTWDVRDSVVIHVGRLFAPTDISRVQFERMVEHKIHLLAWKLLDDEEPYVRASAARSLLSFLLCCWRLRTETSEVSVKQILDRASSMLLRDEEAFARRSACALVAGYLAARMGELLPCLGPASRNSEGSEAPALGLPEVGRLVEALASAASDDADWEVKVAALEFFREILCGDLFRHAWNNFQGDDLKELNPEELGVVSRALGTIVRALDDYDSPVVRAARDALDDLRRKVDECSPGSFGGFVSCLCRDLNPTTLSSILGSSPGSEDEGRDPSREIVSLLDDIEACMAPPAGEVLDRWTSDEEEYLDFGKADCY